MPKVGTHDPETKNHTLYQLSYPGAPKFVILMGR